MDREKNFRRTINNYHRYRNYGKEAKNTLKLIKKLEESFDLKFNQTEQFFSQLIRLCSCKKDNVLLRTLAHDISIINCDFRKINNHHKDKFPNLITQLIQISEQFNGIEKIEKKFKEAHKNRLKYERKSKGIGQLIINAFSIKAQQNDYLNLPSNLPNDYLDNYTGKPLNRKLVRLLNEEANLEKTLVNQCLNQELAIVIRIRKLVRMFAENQIEYERDLITLFSQLDLVTERDVPDSILGLNNKELEQYFRPKRRNENVVPFYSNASTTNQTDIDFYLRNLKNSQTSIDSYKRKVLNKILDKNLSIKKDDQQKTNLYYGSLCSLSDKNRIDQNLNNLTNKFINMNLNAKQNLDNLNTDNLIDNQNIKNLTTNNLSNSETRLNQFNKINQFSETSFHKCKLNHRKQNLIDSETLLPISTECLKTNTKFNPSYLQTIDLTLSPSASAPPLDWSNNDEQKYLDNQRLPTVINQQPLKNTENIWLNQTIYCNECKNYHDFSEVEKAALHFINNYHSLKAQIEKSNKDN